MYVYICIYTHNSSLYHYYHYHYYCYYYYYRSDCSRTSHLGGPLGSIFLSLPFLALKVAAIVLSSDQSGLTKTQTLQIFFAGDLWLTQQRERRQRASGDRTVRICAEIRWARVGPLGQFSKVQICQNGPSPWESWTSEGHFEVNISNGAGIRDPSVWQFFIAWDCESWPYETARARRLRASYGARGTEQVCVYIYIYIYTDT